MSTFTGLAGKEEYSRAVREFLAGTTSSIPVWVGDRTELLDSIALANQFYLRGPVFQGGHAVRPDRLPSALLDMIGDGPLPVGLYEDLQFGDQTAPTLEAFVTGRDVHSLSWMVAKQYARTDTSQTLVVTALDPQPALEGAEWVGPDSLSRGVALLGARPWRRVLLHGNGQDDSLNLSRHTICGRRQGIWAPQGYGPSCHFGQGCYKPDDGVIPVGRITTDSLALLNCFSGPSHRLATYHADYQLLLAAVDGTARSIVVASTACDAGRPEIKAWLSHPEAPARAMNRAIADVNPYPVFLQCGGETVPLRPFSPVPEIAARILTLSQRATALTNSGLLPEHHPLAADLARFTRYLTEVSARDVDDYSQLDRKAADLDAKIARTMFTGGAISAFPELFGLRSIASPTVPAADCSCGEPAAIFTRTPIVAPMIPTTQTVCDRCGDIENAFLDAPTLRLHASRTAHRGDTVILKVSVTGVPNSTPIAGIGLRPSLQATSSPTACRLLLAPDGTGTAQFTLAVSPDTRVQAEYLQPFAVHDLAVTIGRFHLMVQP